MSTVNLLPEDYLKHRRQRRTNGLCIVLLVVVIGGVLGAAAVTRRSAARTRAIRDRVNIAYAEADKLIEQMQELQARKHRMLQKAERTAGLVEKVPRSTLLAILTNSLPEGASLKSLDLQTERIVRKPRPQEANRNRVSKLTTESRRTLESAPETRVSLEITGMAATDVEVAKFIARLARNPLTSSVDLVYSEEKTIEEVPVREFQIKAILRGDADAIELARPARAAEPTQRQPDTGGLL